MAADFQHRAVQDPPEGGAASLGAASPTPKNTYQNLKFESWLVVGLGRSSRADDGQDSVIDYYPHSLVCAG